MKKKRLLESMKLPRFAYTRAQRLVESPKKLLHVIEQAQNKQESARTASLLGRVLEELRTMLRLIKAWAKREYSDVSLANLVLIVGAIVYFLMPADFIPDFIAGLGLADDAAVITWVVATVADELDKYRAWEENLP